MPVGRMVAALAAALGLGAIVAAFASDAPAGFAPVATVVSLLVAIVIAALLVAGVVAIRALAGRRADVPRGLVIAAALAAGGLVVFPVHSSNFYTEEAGEAGDCEGVLPLAQALQNRVADDAYAPVSYFAGCED
jgi:hypothetical protein